MKSVIFAALLVLSAATAFAENADLKTMRDGIAQEKPVPFVFIEPANPWSKDSTVTNFNGELTRLYITAVPSGLDAEMLARLNDPNHATFVLLRRYVPYVRRMVLATKPKSDAYSIMREDEPIYIAHTNIFGESGPMTHINVANLILPAEWKQRNAFAAKSSDGKMSYAYINFADSPERRLSDLWSDRALFDQFVIHLTLRLLEGEARGQTNGLRAHLGAHTGPEINLAFGTTWCQNRGFYEAWPLAQRKVLNTLYPAQFRFAAPQSLRERDRFLVFADNPFTADFEPLARDRQSWNTPQAVMRSNYVNAWLLNRLWQGEVSKGFEKSWRVLAEDGSAYFREFIGHWSRHYPDDEKVLVGLLMQATRSAEDPRPCWGPNIWIGIPPKFDHVDFNASSIPEMTSMLSRLADRMPLKARGEWLDRRAIGTLAQAIYDERAKHCGQFKNFHDVTYFITEFSDRTKISRASLMPMLQTVAESKVILDQFYADEKARLRKIGALKTDVTP